MSSQCLFPCQYNGANEMYLQLPELGGQFGPFLPFGWSRALLVARILLPPLLPAGAGSRTGGQGPPWCTIIDFNWAPPGRGLDCGFARGGLVPDGISPCPLPLQPGGREGKEPREGEKWAENPETQ